MTRNHEPIVTVAELLAHALELEAESYERYLVLAEVMEVHNNVEVADLFDQLARYSELHVREVEVRAQGQALPAIAPWDFKWNCPEGPESPCMDDANYLMNRLQAMELALHNEVRGRDFYRLAADLTPDPEVAALAREMAAEEQEHVDLLRQWIAREAAADPVLEDLDPPNIPE